MRETVICQIPSRQKGIDQSQTRLGAVAHGDRHGPVQRHDRRGIDPEQDIVQRHDLGPVGLCGAGRFGMRRRDGGLQDVGADPAPVVELNRAAAVAMRDGPLAGLTLIDVILARGDLADYLHAHSARADLCRRLGMTEEARASYHRALDLTRQEPERRFLERRLRELEQR